MNKMDTKEKITATLTDVGEAGIKKGVFRSYRDGSQKGVVRFIYELAQKKKDADVLTVCGYPEGSLTDERFDAMIGMANEKMAISATGTTGMAPSRPYDAELLMRELQGIIRRID